VDWIKWFWSSPPAPWQWVGLFVAIFAFGGWIVDTIVRIICRTKLKVRFYSPHGYHIHCEIRNVPIGDRYLIQRRTIQDLTVLVAISDMSTDDLLDQLIYCDNTVRLIGFGYSGEKSRHVMLPASK
jgi:hypothetical protein